MNKTIVQDNSNQPTLRDIIRIEVVGRQTFSALDSVYKMDLTELVKKVEDFVRSKVYGAYLSYEFVSIPYQMAMHPTNSDILTEVIAFVTYSDKEIA